MNCAKCNQPLDQGVQFCGNCGQPTTPPVVSAAPVVPAPSASSVSSVATPPQPLVAAPASQLVPGLSGLPIQPAIAQTPVMTAATPILAAGDHTAGGKATAGLILGIMSMIAWLFPLLGFPVAIIGLVMSILGRRSQHRGLAITGMVLSSIGLVLTLLLSFIAVMAEMKGDALKAPTGLEGKHIETACYIADLPGGYVDDTQASSCTVNAVHSDGGSSFTLKTVDAPNITDANLNEAARLDVRLVQSKIPGSTIKEEGSSTFAGYKAYQAVIEAGANGSAMIYYVYHPQGYDINGKKLKVFALIYDTVEAGYEPMEALKKGWQWR